MFIKNLTLKNFRNYSDIELNFNSNKILIIGKNAQGKTNLLEAIYYLSTLDSLRAKTDNELKYFLAISSSTLYKSVKLYSFLFSSESF